MKALLVIADGLAGRPTDWGGSTCLARASTPNVDQLASEGALGLMDPIAPGVRPGSDTSHLSIFGYDPYTVYTGRGVFEALGIGLDVREGDVCFRANFATVKQEGERLIVTDRRAGRLAEGAELAEALAEVKLADMDVEVTFRASTEHRGALVLRGPDLSADVTDVDPHEEGAEMAVCRPKTDSGEGRRTADLLNDYVQRAHEVLRDHPVNQARRKAGKPEANVLLLRGAAVMPHLPSVEAQYGVQGVCVAGGALYKGVARAAGLEVLNVPGATGDLHTDLGQKAKAVGEALDRAGFVFAHIKGADNAAHDGLAEEKTRFIERMDTEFFGALRKRLASGDVVVCFSGDHTTPTAVGEHTADPVPVLFWGAPIRPDMAQRFDEMVAGKGGLGRFSGRLVPQLMGYCDLGGKYGA